MTVEARALRRGAAAASSAPLSPIPSSAMAIAMNAK